MPTREDAEVLFARIPADLSTIGNQRLRETLGWKQNRYEAAKDMLIADGKNGFPTIFAMAR